MLKRAEKEINRNLKNKKQFTFFKKLKVLDAFSHKSKVEENISNLPVFIDLKTRKLFLYDPMLLDSTYHVGLFG